MMSGGRTSFREHLCVVTALALNCFASRWNFFDAWQLHITLRPTFLLSDKGRGVAVGDAIVVEPRWRGDDHK